MDHFVQSSNKEVTNLAKGAIVVNLGEQGKLHIITLRAVVIWIITNLELILSLGAFHT